MSTTKWRPFCLGLDVLPPYMKSAMKIVNCHFYFRWNSWRDNNKHCACFSETKKANLRDLIAATGLVILLKLDSNRRFFSLCDLEIWWMTPKNNRATLLCYFKLFASFRRHWWIQTGVTVCNCLFGVKINYFFSRVTLQFDWWPWKTIGHLSYATSSFVHHSVVIGEFRIESGNAQFGSKSTIFLAVWPCCLMDDLKNNRATLLCYFKLCASFRSHWWIQTGVTVRKRPTWVKFDDFFCDLDLWPLTSTFCTDVTSVIGNNSWTCHDDTMMGT